MKLKITLHGVAYEVDVEILDPGEGFGTPLPVPPMQYSAPAAAHPAAAPAPAPTPAVTQPQRGAADGNVTSPIAGTVIETKVKSGDNVKEGDLLLVIEAMKMNTSITAPKAGTVKTINVKKDDAIREGDTLVVIG
jgi:biotin carboxyl carrier protein